MATGPAGYPPLWVFNFGDLFALVSTIFIVAILAILALTRWGRHQYKEPLPVTLFYWAAISAALGTCFLLLHLIVPYPEIFWAEWVSFVLQLLSIGVFVLAIVRLMTWINHDDTDDDPEKESADKRGDVAELDASTKDGHVSERGSESSQDSSLSKAA